MLFASHGASAPRGAAICAALGSAAHWTSDSLNLDATSRRALVSLGLLDAAALPKEERNKKKKESIAPQNAPELNLKAGNGNEEMKEGGGEAGEKSPGVWDMIRPYLPIRKMTDDEWTAHLAKQEADEKLKNELIAAGKERPFDTPMKKKS